MHLELYAGDCCQMDTSCMQLVDTEHMHLNLKFKGMKVNQKIIGRYFDFNEKSSFNLIFHRSKISKNTVHL